MQPLYLRTEQEQKPYQHDECEQIFSPFWNHFCCLGESTLQFGQSLWISIHHLQGKCFCSCVACLAENIAGERAGLVGMEVPCGKSVPSTHTLELSQLAILCLFPKHSHLFAFPKWSCFNILPQLRTICLAVCPSVYLVVINSLLPKKWSKHCISLASFPIFSLDGTVFHTTLLSYPFVHSTCETKCFLFSLPHVLPFVTFQILGLTWMLSVSLWISNPITLIWANIFPSRAAVH